MRFSILTPSFNQGAYIEENILSVLEQNYHDFEHIIIDGGSTDNTLEILKKYPHLIWISEKDRGQSDALQKGLSLVTGDILGWINSDDYYLSGTFYDVSNRFSQKGVDWIVGDIVNRYDVTGVLKPVKSQTINYKCLSLSPDRVKQPAAFYRTELVIKSGGFNANFYMIMDYDLWLRLAKIIPPLMAKKTYAVFRHHMNQKTSFKNDILQLREIRMISIREGLKLMYILKLIKFYQDGIKYFFKNFLVRLHLIDKKYQSAPFHQFEE